MANRSKNMLSVVAERIKTLRINHGFTQKELAEKLYKSESTVRMWELGKSEPDLETTRNLATLFRVSTDYLLGNAPATEEIVDSVREDFMNTIGCRMRSKRNELNMTLEEVAKAVGITRQTIQRYESGVISNIPPENIELIARALNTTPSYLMGWDNPCATRERKISTSNLISAQVKEVIETVHKKGTGTENDPVRYVRSYWSLEGELLAVHDEYEKTSREREV